MRWSLINRGRPLNKGMCTLNVFQHGFLENRERFYQSSNSIWTSYRSATIFSKRTLGGKDNKGLPHWDKQKFLDFDDRLLNKGWLLNRWLLTTGFIVQYTLFRHLASLYEFFLYLWHVPAAWSTKFHSHQQLKEDLCFHHTQTLL